MFKPSAFPWIVFALIFGFGFHAAAQTRPVDATRSCAADGSAGASAGLAQHPGLLDHYKARPPCKVAGVDYPVGVPSSIALRDPSTRAWGAALRFAAAEHVVQCLKGVGVIDGYDFTLHGGIGVVDAGCTSLVIRNSRFRVGANCVMPVMSYESAPNVTLENNEIDGGGSRCTSGKSAEVVELSGGGDLVVRYNWIKNVAQHFLSFTGRGAAGGTIDMRYNLEERCGFFQGNHCNGGQIVGGRWTKIQISHNTFISDQPDTALSSDGVTAPTGVFKAGSTRVVDVKGLVVSVHASANSLQLGETVDSPCVAPNTVLVAPLDTSVSPVLNLSKAAKTSGSCPFDVPNAYPSGLVDPIRYVAQLGATLNDGEIEGNTIVVTGPIVGVSYAVYCGVVATRSGPPNQISKVRIAGNFIDARHLLTRLTFWPGPGACSGDGVTIADNIEMNSGSILKP